MLMNSSPRNLRPGNVPFDALASGKKNGRVTKQTVKNSIFTLEKCCQTNYNLKCAQTVTVKYYELALAYYFIMGRADVSLFVGFRAGDYR